MPKKIMFVLLFLLIIFAGLSPLKSEAKTIKKSKMTKMLFMSRSLGFNPIFYMRHPGPVWFLKNAKALNLTNQQINQEILLKKAIFQNVKKGIAKLKTAIRLYKIAVRQPNPSIKELMVREQSVGNAETYLGGIIIPYNIKAFRLLNVPQRAKFKKLRIMDCKKMKAKMLIMHKMMMIRTILKSCRRKLKTLRIKMRMLNVQ